MCKANSDEMGAKQRTGLKLGFSETAGHLWGDPDAPGKIEELLRVVRDLKSLGFEEDVSRIQESVSALVRLIRRKWLMSSNYCPSGSDEEGIECSNAIPEEMQDDPEFLEGWLAILKDVESVRQRWESSKQSALEDSSMEAWFRKLRELDGDAVTVASDSSTALDASRNTAIESSTTEIAEDRKFPEYVLDEIDMRTLAWAYLDEGIELEVFNFSTGWSEDSWRRFRRFERTMDHLGESRRREMIDAMDRHQALQHGDFWQVFKASCNPDFWSTPADRAAIVREANLLPEEMSDYQEDRFGHEYLTILRDAKKGIFTDNTTKEVASGEEEKPALGEECDREAGEPDPGP